MAPNSRPPLTSRIRASFEGRRKSFDGTRKLSKSGRTTSDGQEARSPNAIDTEVSSPLHTTNGFMTQDPETIRNAVDQAINGEAFQNAIAANLAKLIKPSIKSALDTIQPVVEAVYSHEILLRKTNQSVEDILTRLDSNAETTARRESFIDSTYAPPGSPADGEKSADAVDRPVVSRGVAGPDFDQFKHLLEENNARTTETLSGLSTIVESNTTKIAEVAEGVADINTALRPTKESIESLKSSSEQATTTISVLQAQLDQLKADIGQIIAAIGTDLGKNIQAISKQSGAQDTSLLSTHTTKLDLISADLAALKGHADTVEKIESISTELSALKATVEAGNASNTESFTSILTAVGDQTTTLSSIKDAPAHPEILFALQQSNDLHTAHTTALTEIKERSLGSAPTPVTVSEGGSADHSTALQELKSDLEALRENILAGLSSNNENVTGLGTKIDTVVTAIERPNAEILAAVKLSNESHEKHAAALEGIRSIAPAEAAPVADSSDLTEKISAVVAKLDEHTAALDEIKGIGGAHSTALQGIKSISPESPDVSNLSAQISGIVDKLEAHTATLDEIKGFGGSHATALESHGTALEGIRSIGVSSSEGGSVAGLESQMAAIVVTLEGHGVALEEIKGHSSVLDEIKTRSATSNPAPTTAVVSASDDSEHPAADKPFGTIIETLMLHTNLLNEIKEDVSAEILTALHDMGQAQAYHTNLLTEIREADLSDEILTLLHASGDSHNNSLTALEKIQSAILALDEKHVAHATTLDEIKSRSVEHAAPGAEGLEAHITSIVAKLEDHSAALDAIKESHISHATTLGEIKSRSFEPSTSEVPAVDLSGLEAQIGVIVARLEDHSGVLTAIKDGTSASNESHTSHSAVLGEIKDAALASNESHTAHAIALEEIKTTTSSLPELHAAHTTALGEIKNATLASNESHASHSTALSEIKDATLTLNENYNTHATTLSDIKAATLASNEAHGSHTAAFTELKSIQHASASTPGSTDISTLETELRSIISTLESQTATLSSLKDTSTVANPEIISALANSHSLLETHGPLLESIKERSSHTDILSSISELKAIVEDSKADAASHGALVKDLHAETKDSHSNLASAIGALALGGAAGAGATALLSNDEDESEKSSKEVLEEIKAVRALVEASATNVDATKESVTSIVSQIDINHTTITTSINTLSDELKAEIDATGTNIAESIMALDTDIKAIDVSPVNAHLEQHGQDLKSLSSKIDTLDNSVKETGTHVVALHDGVHFNEKGVGQLKEHVVSIPGGVAAEPISEGAWFGSKSPSLSRVVSRSVVEPERIVEETPEPQLDVTEKEVGIQPVQEHEDLSPEVVEEFATEPSEPQMAGEKEVEIQPVVHSEPILEEPQEPATEIAEASFPVRELIVEPKSVPEIPGDDPFVEKSINDSELEAPIQEEAQEHVKDEVVEHVSTPEVQADDQVADESTERSEPEAPIQEEAQQTLEKVIKPEPLTDDALVVEESTHDKEVEVQPEVVEPEPSLQDPVIERGTLPEEQESAVDVIGADDSVVEQEVIADPIIEPEVVAEGLSGEQEPTVEQEAGLEQEAEVQKDSDEPSVNEANVANPVIETESSPGQSNDDPIEERAIEEAVNPEKEVVEEKDEESLPLDVTPTPKEKVDTATQEHVIPNELSLPDEQDASQPLDVQSKDIDAPEPGLISEEPSTVENTLAPASSLLDETVVHKKEAENAHGASLEDTLPVSETTDDSEKLIDDNVRDIDNTRVTQDEPTQEQASHADEDPIPEESEKVLDKELEVNPILDTHASVVDTQPLSDESTILEPSEPVNEDSVPAEPLDESASPVTAVEYETKHDETTSNPLSEVDPIVAGDAGQQPSDVLDKSTSVMKDELIPEPILDEEAGHNELIGQELDHDHVKAETPVFEDTKEDSFSAPVAKIDEHEPEAVKEIDPEMDHPTSAPIDESKLDDDKSQAAQEKASQGHSLDDSEAKDANWPVTASEADQPSSPFVESPILTKSDDQHLEPESPEDISPPKTSRSLDPTGDEPHTAASFLPPSHQMPTDPTLDSGHASPLDETSSNPFEDSDNLLSPSSILSPKSVLSPEAAIDAPAFPPPVDYDNLQSPDLVENRAPPSPDIRQRSPLQPLEDDDYRSPGFASHPPSLDTLFPDLPQRSPRTQPSEDPHSSLPPHLQLDAPSPGFPDIRHRSPDGPFEDEEEELVSPSSEFAVPITPGMKEKAPTQPHDLDNPDSPAFPALKEPDVASPPLASPADFGFREDSTLPEWKGKGAEVGEVGSREETETEPESALASPVSPVFSEGGTETKGKKGKKGKKEKKEKKGKGKKEKVPFEMEGEDAQ